MFITWRWASPAGMERSGIPVRVHALVYARSGMSVNLWGESPLYMNTVPYLIMVTKVLAEGKRLRLAMASQEGIIARWCLKEAGVQSYELSLPRT